MSQKLQVGLKIIKRFKDGEDSITVTSVDPPMFQYRGETYNNPSKPSLMMLHNHGSNKKTVSGWDFLDLENPNHGTRAPRQSNGATGQSDNIGDLLMSPDEMMAKVKAEAEAKIRAIEEASKNRVQTLKDAYSAAITRRDGLHKAMESLKNQINTNMDTIAKLHGALKSLDIDMEKPADQPPAPQSEPTPAPVVESPKPDEASKVKGKGKVK